MEAASKFKGSDSWFQRFKKRHNILFSDMNMQWLSRTLLPAMPDKTSEKVIFEYYVNCRHTNEKKV